MPPKAYRWVHEMLEMADTAAEYGQFEKNLFEGIAEASELGLEKPDERVKGKTVEDVVKLFSEGISVKKLKQE
ncbi:hypothetical protein BDZ45DRAFT_755255 [Acephala macrosclerotiorum]|nr:hypothetical protein BDZ45DRAFT_755255 [Acephala macrosclerotiorum]